MNMTCVCIYYSGYILDEGLDMNHPDLKDDHLSLTRNHLLGSHITV